MKKSKLMSLLLVVAIMCSMFVACNKKADSGNTIKIGLNYELSGDVAQYGQACVVGIEMAAKEINAAGGINGKNIELVKLDNKSENNEAMNIATRLATQDKVAVILGPATSGAFKAGISVASTYKVPMVTCSGTANNLTTGNDGKTLDWIFRTCFRDDFQGTVMGNFAATDLKAAKAVILYENANDYSNGLADAFEASFKSKGGTITGKEAFSSKDEDFSSILTKIKSLDYDIIYLPAYYENVGPIIKQARAIGITAPFLGADGYDSEKIVSLAGSKEALNGVYFTNHYSSGDTSPEVVSFVEKFNAANSGKEPGAFHALGYDMMNYVADAIKRAGSTDGEAIKAALADTKDFNAVTGKFSINEKHDCIKATVVIEFKDGVQTYRTKISG